MLRRHYATRIREYLVVYGDARVTEGAHLIFSAPRAPLPRTERSLSTGRHAHYSGLDHANHTPRFAGVGHGVVPLSRIIRKLGPMRAGHVREITESAVRSVTVV